MSEVLIGMFEESGSFADAKNNMGLLEEIGTWQPTFSTRVRAAVKANSQVQGSWGVPERATALVNKWKAKSS